MYMYVYKHTYTFMNIYHPSIDHLLNTLGVEKAFLRNKMCSSLENIPYCYIQLH